MVVTAHRSGSYLPGHKPAPGESFADAVRPMLAVSHKFAGRINAAIQPMTRFLSARAALCAVTTTVDRYRIAVLWAVQHGYECDENISYTVVPGQMRCVCRCGAERWP